MIRIVRNLFRKLSEKRAKKYLASNYPEIGKLLLQGGHLSIKGRNFLYSDISHINVPGYLYPQSIRSNINEILIRQNSSSESHSPRIYVSDNEHSFMWEDEKYYNTLHDLFMELDFYLTRYPSKHFPLRNVSISISEVLKKGTFGPIRLGISHSDLEDILGKPDFYHSNTGTGYRFADIWAYGTKQEFHFFDGKLLLIYNDYVHCLHEIDTEAFKLKDLFFLDDNFNKIDHHTFQKKIKALNLQYRILKSKLDDTYIISFDSGCDISFHKDESKTNIYYPFSYSIADPEFFNRTKIYTDVDKFN